MIIKAVRRKIGLFSDKTGPSNRVQVIQVLFRGSEFDYRSNPLYQSHYVDSVNSECQGL